MAEKPPTSTSPTHANRRNPNIQQPPLPSNAGSNNSNFPFTPRSTTFPDGLDSDPEFDVFDPTPVHSPGGPHYDDLPPSYDEAQQEALEQARAGITPPNPNDLEIHRLVLNNHDQPLPQLTAQRTSSSLLSDPNAYEFEPENRRNASGLGMNVPVTQVRSSEHIPVGQIPTGNIGTTPNVASDPTSALLDRALEFTKHAPDADARYAPRLTRCIAIPQQSLETPSREQNRSDHHRGSGGRGRGRCGPPPPPRSRAAREARQMPGGWPESQSSETLPTDSQAPEEPVQFLRSYAKALHAHSIRPAEFTEFLDGLNALCLATNTTARDLVNPSSNPEAPSSLVQNYINSTNESFFAPRGLKISLKSLSTLLSALHIPSERGQKAGAVASVLDSTSTSEQKAGALQPWIEKLEIDVPGPSTRTLLLREMGERFSKEKRPQNREREWYTEKARLARGEESEDPPHSIPGVADPPHSAPDEPRVPGGWGFPPFVARGGCGPGHRGGPGNWGHWAGNAGYRGGRGWGAHHGRGWDSHHGPWRRPPHGFHGGWAGPGQRGCNSNSGPGAQSWAAWGESIGKWGEQFGKRMEIWGEQFGKRAEEWGNDVGRRAEAWGEDVEKRAEAWGEDVERRFDGRAGGLSRSTTQQSGRGGGSGEGDRAASGSPEGLGGQETGVCREDGKVKEKDKGREECDDDSDTSSISSDSSSDSDPELEYPDTHEIFLLRIREINNAALLSTQKGKKSAEEIARERDAAIAKAQTEKTDQDLKIEQKREKWAKKKELKRKKREIKKEHRRLKRELKGLGERDKREAKRQQKHEWREKRREHRLKKEEARREWREARHERKRMRREGFEGYTRKEEEMVWVVVENLGV
ncbi:hypothetical protein K469DRAFT_754943 [Zopfia rhizophila CBS 207.26]|uniref:Uncharacterized protein n=1 Tax=Zopfia rhizophila CBS 207.26 TaxID=1314779 RepID=A0A6A6DJB0_9PEZI|nr:hypothetical protein K469DRAFT_754943 [Zopfia rhizophila CBS 207.26]